MRILLIQFILLCLVGTSNAADGYFLQKIRLETGQTIIVAEGELEARSIGSFSVRLYDNAEPVNATTFYRAGLIYPRDGTIKSITLADINSDSQSELIVIVRSAGTGGYLSAHAFSVSAEQLFFLRSVEDLAADADPVHALKTSQE